jgi:hypothetical protein
MECELRREETRSQGEQKDSSPLFPGPHAMRTFLPFEGGWTL